MGKYTEYMGKKEYEISPIDDDYTNQLIKTARSFRSFASALDEFIVKHGYDGDISDNKAKVNFIKHRFDDAGITIEKRIPQSWYDKGIRADKRDIAFKMCFAFGLDLAETQEFFRKIYLQRGIDCHNITETIYYFAISHGLSFSDAEKILCKAPRASKENIDLNNDILYTSSIVDEIDRFDSADELLVFLNENISRFGYNNATSYKLINEVWTLISDENGYANREAEILYPGKKHIGKKRSVWDIYMQIFGYEIPDDENGCGTVIYQIKGDRTLSSVIKNNVLLPKEARESFPDRKGLEDILNGVNNKSHETVRKTLILLVFYKYCAYQILKANNLNYDTLLDNVEKYIAENGERCQAEIDKYLVEAGYPELYDGNPYDWIFLFCMRNQNLLDAFRSFMTELYMNTDEYRDK